MFIYIFFAKVKLLHTDFFLLYVHDFLFLKSEILTKLLLILQ